MRRVVFSFVFAVILFPFSAFADGGEEGRSQWIETKRPEFAGTPGSDASFDKRLPPVLPGETVYDSGKKMKVWSTSGPVPVSQAPEPWSTPVNLGGIGGGAGIGIIVDDRGKSATTQGK